MRLPVTAVPAVHALAYAGPEAGSACVLKDPAAPPDARYRIMAFSAWFEGEPGEVLDSDEGHRRLEVQNAAEPGDEKNRHHRVPAALAEYDPFSTGQSRRLHLRPRQR